MPTKNVYKHSIIIRKVEEENNKITLNIAPLLSRGWMERFRELARKVPFSEGDFSDTIR